MALVALRMKEKYGELSFLSRRLRCYEKEGEWLVEELH